MAAQARQAGRQSEEFEFAAALERGQLMDVPPTAQPTVIPYWHLCRALVAQQTGDAAQAAASKAAGIKILESQGFDDGAAGQLLRQGANAKWGDVEDLLLLPQLKAVLLLVLSQDAPHIKTACLDLAEKLNHSLKFPHHLVRRNTARLRQ